MSMNNVNVKVQDNAEGLRKTLSSNNKSHSGNIRAVVDYHAYYVTNQETGMSEGITAISTTLVGRKKRLEGKILSTQYIPRNQLTYNEKRKLTRKGGRAIQNVEQGEYTKQLTGKNPQPDLKHVTKIRNGCEVYK